ncbi:hypothetical protein VIGAN_01419400 [Vigna angularis var. angularis]|uniref:Uncharacterized protein n=1 Tax=Vigna angularis var. angularis TaxID=157739 RepID=A0A0S3R6G9_PHAAN|nr:hypothetical protein VIGAN_01419400 [Vigna angularis var. angularis]
MYRPWCLSKHEQYLIAEHYDDQACYGSFSISFLVPEFVDSSYGVGPSSAEIDYCFLELMGFTGKLRIEMCA